MEVLRSPASLVGLPDGFVDVYFQVVAVGQSRFVGCMVPEQHRVSSCEVRGTHELVADLPVALAPLLDGFCSGMQWPRGGAARYKP